MCNRTFSLICVEKHVARLYLRIISSTYSKSSMIIFEKSICALPNQERAVIDGAYLVWLCLLVLRFFFTVVEI